MVENNLIEYHKGYISVSLGCIPSPEGGSVLCRYTYDSTQYADLTPKEIVEKAWKQYYEELNNLDLIKEYGISLGHAEYIPYKIIKRFYDDR